MVPAETRGVYFGDKDWMEDNEFCWFRENDFEKCQWRIPNLPGFSSFQIIRKIVERVSSPPHLSHHHAGATAVYVAKLYGERPLKCKQVIVKIVMRIPNIPIRQEKKYVMKQDINSLKLPVTEEWPDFPIETYESEVEVLRFLTKKKFAYSPNLLTSFEQIKRNPWVKDGFLGFIIMEELHATTVSDVWEFRPRTTTQMREQLSIQEAFKIAFIALMNEGVALSDPASRNLMWDSKARKCYFVDFELAKASEDARYNYTWEEYSALYQTRWSYLSRWGLITDDQHKEMCEVLHPSSPS